MGHQCERVLNCVKWVVRTALEGYGYAREEVVCKTCYLATLESRSGILIAGLNSQGRCDIV